MSALAPWLGAVVVLAGCGRFGFPQGGPDAGEPGIDGAGVSDARPDAIPGTVDASIDAPPMVVCPGSAILCEDFEGGDFAQWTRVELFGPAMAVVNGVRPRTGALALDASVSSAASDDSAAAPTLRFPAVSTGVLAARIWFNLESPLDDFNLIVVFRNHQTGNYVTAGGNSIGDWVSTEDTGPSQFDHDTTFDTPPLATWTCAELVYTFPAGPDPGRIQVYVDDLIAVDVTANETSPAFTEVQVGIARGDEAGFHLFVDDVVIADQHIGC